MIDYLLIAITTWLVTGIVKFSVNSIRGRALAFGEIGYGGFPSNHSAIVTSITVLVALEEGIDHPAFGVALAFAFIVLLDATSLRRQIETHARALNELLGRPPDERLREHIGHSAVDVAGGIAIGAALAVVFSAY